jgi:MoxR-like ATPase
MSSFIDLMANVVWSDADIANRARYTLASQVPESRQDELRTIMLGHVAQMRPATAAELGEIMQVKALTEQAAAVSAQARADMALLAQALAAEQGQPYASSVAVEALLAQRSAHRQAQAAPQAPTPQQGQP